MSGEIRELNIKLGDNKRGRRRETRAKANPAEYILGRSGTTGLQDRGPWSAVSQLLQGCQMAVNFRKSN